MEWAKAARKWESIEKDPQVISYFKRCFSYLKEEKKIPHKDDCFTTILDKMGFPLPLTTLNFPLSM